MNHVALVGRLLRHPIVKFEGESQTCTFTLLVAETSREGKTFELFTPCTAWGRTAEACSLLNADDLVALQGKLTWQKRTGKCGQEHSQMAVNVREITTLQTAEVPT